MFEGSAADEGATDGGTVGGDARADGQFAGLFFTNEKCASNGSGDEVQHASQDEVEEGFEVPLCCELEGQLIQHLESLACAGVNPFEVGGTF